MSADICAQIFLAAGVPAQKLVMGIAFYAHAMQMRTADNNGLNQKAIKAVRVGGFSYVHDSLVNNRGYVRYWDGRRTRAIPFYAEERYLLHTMMNNQ